ncbi:MAG TPA: PAS domain S-box protein [Clostridiales bacterium]|nr:PAS domain S-box protein [Clostridiales bacterium]HQP70682.1 PAS domain S-box protein [Clostridiales bacterium]
MTEELNQRDELKKSEARFRSLIEFGVDGILLGDMNGNIIEVNEMACSLIGMKREELIGKYVSIIPFTRQSMEKEPLRFDLLKEGKILIKERDIQRSDGKIINIEMKTKMMSDGTYQTIFRDITEKKKKEDEIAELKARFEYVLGATNTGFDIIDEDFNVQYTDPNWALKLGDYRGIKCYEYFMGRDSKCTNCGIPIAFEKGRTVITEEHLEKENRYIEVHTIPFAAVENKKRIVAEFNIDITERKNKEIELKKEIAEKEIAHREIRQLLDTLELKVQERTRELELSNEAMESFSYSVSHDLRAPLRHITGFSEMIKKELSESKPDQIKIKNFLDKVVSSSAKMESQIDSILKFSRTSRQALVKERIDMNGIVKDAVNEVMHNHQNDIVDWKISELPNVYADRNLILSVWINLIDNALKFTKNQEKPVIEIGSKEISEGYEFYIKDNGAGFDMEYSHKLFGVFQRLHLEKDYPGTGIGLANVRRIIDKHGGSIRAESDGNTGAVFYFSLPMEGGIK